MHSSVEKMWDNYLKTIVLKNRSDLTYNSWHFGDNKIDANKLIKLVLKGIKTATAPSLWELELHDETIPEPGNLNVVTNWDGVAQCVIETTEIEIVPFNKISAAHAQREGEGNLSLEFWRRVHWDYYNRVLEDSPNKPSKNMPIVCEQFKVVYPL